MNFVDVDDNNGDSNNNGTGDDNIQNGIDTVKRAAQFGSNSYLI